MTCNALPAVSRWSPVAAVLLVLLTFNLAVQAQNLSEGSGTNSAPARSIWKRMKTPNPSDSNALLGLSADSENDVWSVGDFLSLRFDGKTWTAFSLAQPNQGSPNVPGIAAISPTNVWAVGETESGSHFGSLIEHFDGTKWAVVRSPQFTSGSELVKVLAISANDIFAVGDFNTDKLQSAPLVEHYDGAKWTVVAKPRLKKGETGILTGIAAISDTDIWATGTGLLGGAVVFHFDGQRWSRVPFPLSRKVNQLSAPTAISTNDVWVVGDFTGNDLTNHTLTAHWDGKAWKVVPSPDGGGPGSGNLLTGVSAISTTDVWASGFSSDPQLGFLNVVEHWDGTRWKISPIPSHDPALELLTDILAFPSGSVFTAGWESPNPSQINSVIFHTTQGK